MNMHGTDRLWKYLNKTPQHTITAAGEGSVFPLPSEVSFQFINYKKYDRIDKYVFGPVFKSVVWWAGLQNSSRLSSKLHASKSQEPQCHFTATSLIRSGWAFLCPLTRWSPGGSLIWWKIKTITTTHFKLLTTNQQTALSTLHWQFLCYLITNIQNCC